MRVRVSTRTADLKGGGLMRYRCFARCLLTTPSNISLFGIPKNFIRKFHNKFA